MQTNFCRKFYILLLLLFVISIGQIQAQFELSGELRSRAEFRNGFRQARQHGDKPAFIVTQRSRLNLDYEYKDIFRTFFSVQDVRIWGAQNQFEDRTSVGLFQAWGEFKVFPKLKIKAGRQEMLYDDGYLFGRRNWRNGGFSHDAVLVKFRDSTFQSHLGLVFNQSGEVLSQGLYSNDYSKSIQFLWLNKTWDASKMSFIFINRGLQRSDSTIHYTQTFGPDLKLVKEKFSLLGIFYYQTGKDTLSRDVRAYFWSAKLGFKPSPKLEFLAGADVFSGTNTREINNTPSTKIHNFDNLYSFRHQLFGHMDYFYVGYNPPVGLQDMMLKTTWKPNKKFTGFFDIHAFNASANIANPENTSLNLNKYLGTEADIFFEYRINEFFRVNGGYAQIFLTDSFVALRGRGDSKKVNNWFWFQLQFNPVFIKKSKEIEKN